MSGQRFIVGDAIEAMTTMAPASVDVVITSPPFLGLRDYRSGDPRELGHEGSPGAFIEHLLEYVGHCARVLKPEGSLCVELGDTFADSGGAGGDYNPGGLREGQPKWRQSRDQGDRRSVGDENRPGGHHNGGDGWPPGKSLCFIPELFAASLAYGRNLLTGKSCTQWRARNFICWARRNPTPGAVGDKLRVGTSYITIACRERARYWDPTAIANPAARDYSNEAMPGQTEFDRRPDQARVGTERTVIANEMVPGLDWMIEPGEDTWLIANGKGKASPVASGDQAHFAMWPEEVARRLICAMCPPGGVVLDPFCGSGTTLAAAQGVGRAGIGIDLDPANAQLAREKVGMFLEVQ